MRELQNSAMAQLVLLDAASTPSQVQKARWHDAFVQERREQRASSLPVSEAVHASLTTWREPRRATKALSQLKKQKKGAIAAQDGRKGMLYGTLQLPTVGQVEWMCWYSNSRA